MVEFGATGDDGEPVVFHLDMAALRQGEGLTEPLGVGLRTQRLSGLRAETLPGQQGVVFVAVQGGDVLGHAGGEGVCYTGHEITPRPRGCVRGQVDSLPVEHLAFLA